jgi:hypothetical protein
MNAIPMIVQCAANQSKGAPPVRCIWCGHPAWLPDLRAEGDGRRRRAVTVLADDEVSLRKAAS